MAAEMRQYDLRTSAPFKKTTEKWGGLSNMASGYPIVVNGIKIRSIEALYQACRFPHLPDVQEKIILQTSPMTAKMVGKPFISESRSDWLEVRILIMKWCLRVKLSQNWERFSSLLLETQDMPIVELSNKDDFWGAKPLDEHIHAGVNALGRLLMELRALIVENDQSRFMNVPPLNIVDFKILGEDIRNIVAEDLTQQANTQITML